ncbi:hypothetical protein B0H19DRAFT_1055259 [Mycena capillaripes]|nr:hypothetical protein B0H19DRAFT_1055259 [Mycena capillaripes]
MPSLTPGSLSKPDEAAVRKVLKTLRATKYEDPVDQDSFLVESANTVLQFRSQVSSFAMVPDLGECVFTIRSMMHANNAHLGTPFSDAFISIQDFAGEIIRKRQLFRERKRANADRIKAAEGIAARLERRAALEHAAEVNKKTPLSPDEDTISIPSSSEDSGTDEPPPDPPASPITVDLTNIPPSSQVRLAFPLSPLNELGFHLSRLSMRNLPSNPLPSPLSPNLSLPDLVPDFTLLQRKSLVKGGGWKRGRTTTRNQRDSPAPVPVAQCNTLRLVPRPTGPLPHSLRHSFVDDWLQSKPKPADLPVSKKKYSGIFKPSAGVNRTNRRTIFKKVKRCYHCTAADHLVALCPLRETID